MAETYLLDGTDVQTLAWIGAYEGLFETPELRGNDLTVPSRHGAQPVARPFGVGVLTLRLELLADSLAERNDLQRSLTQLVKPGRTVVGTRRREFTAGTEDHTATLRYLSGLGGEMILETAARLALTFEVLDGVWYGAALTPAIPATLTVPGDAVTDRMTLVLPGAGTLTNTTTGTAITVTAGATLDVDAQTTSGSLSDVVTSGDALGRWFVLQPGSNVITWSGAGTPTISYQPAHT